MTTEEQYDNPTDKRLRKEKFLSVKYQIEWIRALKDQIDFANNPDVLPDYVLFLGIHRRRIEQ